MTPARSNALVFFGATGDLAYKKIFPALQSMARRGTLDFPVIGVAKSGSGLPQQLGTARRRGRAAEHEIGDVEAFAGIRDGRAHCGPPARQSVQAFRYLLNQSSVRCQASLAAASS